MDVKQKLNGFDKLAKVYDFSAKLIFGRSIKESQLYFLKHIPDQSNVLILGGGTGWLLCELQKLKPHCGVWYVDASEKMIALAKRKSSVIMKTYFVHGTEQSIPKDVTFDVVITPFYLDMFSPNTLRDTVMLLKSIHKSKGLWVATDFVDGGKWWQKSLLYLMYAFFRVITNIEATGLPAWPEIISECGYSAVKAEGFYNNFIRSVLYRREN